MDLTGASRSVVDALRLLGPPVCILASAFLLAMLSSRRSRSRLLLAGRGLQHRSGPRWRVWVSGVMLPLLGISALTSAFSIEQEIRNGPNRMIGGVKDLVSQDDRPAYWVFAAGTDHFMNGSALPASADSLAFPPDVSAAAFTLNLSTIERASGQSVTGLVLGPTSGPDSHSGPKACVAAPSICSLTPGDLMADRSDGYSLGEEVHIRGTAYRVAAYFDRPMSLLNRSVVYAVPRNPSAAATYGLVATGERAEIEAATKSADVQVLSTAELEGFNSSFWSGNGTPILMLLILLIAVFGGAAIFASQRAEHAAVRPVFRTIRSLGLTSVEAAQVDVARGLLRLLIPAAPALLLSWFTVKLLNASILGFHASISAATALAAIGVVVLASVLAGMTSWLVERRQPLVGS